jgi:hypothetical protein
MKTVKAVISGGKDQYGIWIEEESINGIPVSELFEQPVTDTITYL